jgi:hypothetical protein
VLFHMVRESAPERARKIAAILEQTWSARTRIEPCGGSDVLCTNLIAPAIAAHHGRDAEYLMIDATIVHDLGPADSPLRREGDILFEEFGGGPGNGYTWVELGDDLTASLLQQRLIEFGLPINVAVGMHF